LAQTSGLCLRAEHVQVLANAPRVMSDAAGTAQDPGEWGQEYDDWDLDDTRLRSFSAWASWTRDDVKFQTLAWMVASVAVLGREGSWMLWPGLIDAFGKQEPGRLQQLVGWAVATLMSMGWATGMVQLVFTFEQRAMNFPPGSVLIFWKFRPPNVGSVVYFDGSDGRSYVRRVGVVNSTGDCVKTVGDLSGSPDDTPLYSTDGSAEWLETRSVRGSLAAGPCSSQVLGGMVVAALLLSPSATTAFLVTNQPFIAFWLSVILRFFFYLCLYPIV